MLETTQLEDWPPELFLGVQVPSPQAGQTDVTHSIAGHHLVAPSQVVTAFSAPPVLVPVSSPPLRAVGCSWVPYMDQGPLRWLSEAGPHVSSQ